MKKLLALLLVAVMIVPTAIGALSVLAEEAPEYVDVVNLLPESEDVIQINGGIPSYSLVDGKLYLTRPAESSIAWPSIKYDMDVNVDLSVTPYLHMSFETSGVGDRGVNGYIYYTVGDGEEVAVQLSAAGGNGVDDFRDTAEMYVDLAAYLGITETIHIHRISLSVYGGVDETIVWNTLAMAKKAVEEETPVEPTPAEPTNVALGKKYVTSPLYRQGGKDVNWAYDPNAPITYPDTDGVELTDGIFPSDDATYSDPAFFGFSGSPDYQERGYAYIRVDLEAAYDLSKLILYVGSAGVGSGISAAGMTVSYYKVDDLEGTNPVELGKVNAADDENAKYIPVPLETKVNAQFIEIRITRGGWMFVTEFEAYTAVDAGEDPVEPEDPKDPDGVEVEEVIEVDGDLTDTGWVKATWNTFNLWQQPKAAKPEDRTAKTAVRADADNIYLAFVIDGTIAPNILSDYAEKVAGGLTANGAQTSTYTQTGASTFRLWLRTTDTERYLIDVQYLGEELGWVATRAIYPTGSTLTWDDLAGLIDIAVVYADGTVTAEFAIDKAAFGVEDDFRMFFSYWDNYADLVDETNEEAYQVIHVCSENAQVSETGVIQYYSGPTDLTPYISFADEEVALGSYFVELEPGTVQEVIVVDGDLNDTGWVKAEWVENGHWQGSEIEYPGDEINGKYTVRTDDENIYIAFEMNTIAPNTTEKYNPDSFGQSTATNIRVWFKPDAENRTFFDLQYNGSEFTLANWNTTHAAVKDNTQFVVKYEDGKLVAEIAVNMKDLGIEDSFYLLLTYSETFETGYNAIHFTTAESLNNPEGGANANYWDVGNTYSYTKYNVEDLLLGFYKEETDPEPEIPDVDYEEDIAAKVGDLLEDPDFAIDLTSSVKDGVMTVVLTLKDLKDGLAMQALTAQLYYDVERLALLNGYIEYSDGSTALDCATALPYGEKSKWENLTTVKDDGMIDIIFIIAEDPSQVLDADHPIELTFTFEVKEGFDKAGVYVPTESVGSINLDKFERYYGNGAYVVANIATEEPEEPEIPGELIDTYEVNSGAIYATGSHTVLASVAGNTTIVDITNYLLGGTGGKDYNYFFVYAVEKGEDGNYVVTAEYETLGRPDGVKSDVAVPENGYLVCISASGIEEMAEQLNVGNIVVFEGFDPAVLSTLEPNQNIEGAKVSFYAVGEEEPVEPEEPEYAGEVNVATGSDVEVKKAEAIPQYSQADLTDGVISTGMSYGSDPTEWFSFYYNENYADQTNVDRVEMEDGTVMNVGNLVINLADYYALGSVRIHYNVDYIPEYTNIYVSADGVNFTLVSAKATTAADGEVEGKGCWIEFPLDAATAAQYARAASLDEVVAGQYVKIEFVFSGMFAMLDEVEVISLEKEPEPCTHENISTNTVDPTCTEAGYVEVVCDDCGEVLSNTEIPALGHNYVDGVCTRCGEEDPDYVEPELELIGTFELNTGAVYASGSHTILVRIGENTTIEEITGYLLADAGKDYNYFLVYAVEADADGNYVITAEYELLGRPDGVKSDVEVPENGFLVCISASGIEETADAINVGDIVVLENVDLAALAALQPGENIEGAKASFYAAEEPGCKHENTTTTTEKPTCTEAGYTEIVCDDCGEVLSHVEIPALGHSYADGVCTRCGEKDPDYVCEHKNTTTKTKDATCTEAGYIDVVCDDCGETISHEVLPATGHKNTTTKTEAATCTEAGYEDVVCNDCGEVISHKEIPALGHDFKDGVCTRCGEKDPDYKDPKPAGLIGDVNFDGQVNSTDYMMLKRHILGTRTLSEEALKVADVDYDGNVTSTDYIKLKRYILETYEIKDPNA